MKSMSRLRTEGRSDPKQQRKHADNVIPFDQTFLEKVMTSVHEIRRKKEEKSIRIGNKKD